MIRCGAVRIPGFSAHQKPQVSIKHVTDYILWLDKLGMGDLDKVGGKNASLGKKKKKREMIGNLSELGVSVPGGPPPFAHPRADAFREFSGSIRAGPAHPG